MYTISNHAEAHRISVKRLPFYLCSLATGVSEDEDGNSRRRIQLGMCRNCECQCVYGQMALAHEKELRKYVPLY